MLPITRLKCQNIVKLCFSPHKPNFCHRKLKSFQIILSLSTMKLSPFHPKRRQKVIFGRLASHRVCLLNWKHGFCGLARLSADSLWKPTIFSSSWWDCYFNFVQKRASLSVFGNVDLFAKCNAPEDAPQSHQPLVCIVICFQQFPN